VLRTGNDVGQMMKVVGEEGTSMADFTVYLKAELLDAAYLQQNSFDETDAACSAERQRHVFGVLCGVLDSPMAFPSRDAARAFFHKLTQTFRDWNVAPWGSPAFAEGEKAVLSAVASVKPGA